MFLHNKSCGSLSQMEQKIKRMFHFNLIASLFTLPHILKIKFFSADEVYCNPKIKAELKLFWKIP